jgi:hypothetical protein
MEQVTIGQIVGAVSSLMVILGFIKLIYEFVKQSILNKIKKNEEDIKILKQEMEVKKAEARDSKEERLLLMNGVLACLKGLKEQGCNGPVTEVINQIETYLMEKSHD